MTMPNMNKCCPLDGPENAQWQKQLLLEAEKVASLECEEIAEKLAIIAHPLRLKLLFHLLMRENCVCELVHKTGEKDSLVSHHLGVLRNAGIVKSFYRSKWKRYALKDKLIEQVLVNIYNNKKQ